MSWQSYVDEHLMLDVGGGRHLSAAAIVGTDGNIWAQSASFPKIQPDEISKIVAAFSDPDSNELASNGLYLGGEKYMVIQGEPGAVIRGKKGSGGCTIKKTNCAMIFGLYADSLTPGECSNLVEKLGEYLIEQGI